MARIQCTTAEVVAILHLSINTVYDACMREHGCTLGEFLDRYREEGKASLRRAQFHAATKKGNTTMMRWLGIQYLEQSPEVVMIHKTPIATATDQKPPEAPALPSGFAIQGLEGPSPSGNEISNEKAKEEVLPPDPNVITTTGRVIG